MDTNFLNTQFAPAQRSTIEEVEKQKALFSQKNIFSNLLDSTPDYLVVLNQNRQIVYANKSAIGLLNNKQENNFIGTRLGELLKCQHAFETEGGCGTTEFCRTCGATEAILSSLEGKEDVQEFRIIQSDNYNALDFRVWAKPIEIDGIIYSIYTFSDISDEKRRIALERIFFHDVLNTAGGIKNFIDLLEDANPDEIIEYTAIAGNLAYNLIEEIKAQRDLILAESKELVIDKKLCDPNKIVKDIVNLYINNSVAKGKSIKITTDTCSIKFNTDPVLLARVLGNMLKNALESTPNNNTVKIGCKQFDKVIQFFVHNIDFIPRPIQNQIFNRSFSTKGEGRGLGTYSMKLITKNYLEGRIFFNSDEIDGTTFFAEFSTE